MATTEDEMMDAVLGSEEKEEEEKGGPLVRRRNYCANQKEGTVMPCTSSSRYSDQPGDWLHLLNLSHANLSANTRNLSKNA